MPSKHIINYSTQTYSNLGIKYENDYCFTEKIGKLGIQSTFYQTIKADTLSIIEPKLTSKIFQKINYEEITSHLLSKVAFIRQNFTDLIIVGMGGAILNPKAVLALSPKHSKVNIHYLDTTDPNVFDSVIMSLNLAKTAVIVISNSGETLETISLYGALFNSYTEKGIGNLQQHFYFIVQDTNNYLNNVAIKQNYAVIPHDLGISGRYSGFSTVTIFPGLIAGLNMQSFCEGANSILEDFWKYKADSTSCESMLDLFMINQPIVVNLAYNSKLAYFLEWYSQIISESLGKQKRGITPLAGLGPMDQHSMLQLYLEGPRDKLFTLFYVEDLSNSKVNLSETHLVKGKTLHEVHKALFQATEISLKANKLPVRTIRLSDLNEKSLGALMMHVSLEVILYGLLIDINPFDQPGVEQIKTSAKKILSDINAYQD